MLSDLSIGAVPGSLPWVQTFVCILSDLSIAAKPRRLAFKKKSIVKEIILHHVATYASLTENAGSLKVLMSQVKENFHLVLLQKLIIVPL
jgi:hypothetical protein